MVLETPELEHLDEDAFDVVTRYADLSEWNHNKDQIRKEGGKVNMCKALADWIAEERAEGFTEGRSEGFTEGRTEGRMKGIAESIVSLLEDIGAVPGQLASRILNENSLEQLNRWLKLAARAESIQEFERMMQDV